MRALSVVELGTLVGDMLDHGRATLERIVIGSFVSWDPESGPGKLSVYPWF
jgi:hypothetical protein